MDFTLDQPLPKFLGNINEPEEVPQECISNMKNSKELGTTYTLNTLVKQEINTNSSNSGLTAIKREVLDIKTEIDDSANNSEETKGMEYEFYDFSTVKHEEPSNQGNSSVFSANVAHVQRGRPRVAKKTFCCTYCSYTCSRKTYLTDHLRTHTKDKPYSCTFCDYKCATNSHMTRHLKTHSEEKPYGCTLCDFKSSWKECLNNHLKAHINEKSHSCNLCNYKSVKKSNLVRHMARHTRDKSYNCTICDYNCFRRSELLEHQKMHNGHKSYHCPLCGYKSSRKQSLSCHLRTHAAEKPYSCEFCDYKCSKKNSLTCHLKTHSIAKTNSTLNKTDGNDSENTLNFDLEQDEVDDHKFKTVKVEELYIKEEF